MAGDRIWFTGGEAPTMCVWMIFLPPPPSHVPQTGQSLPPLGLGLQG